MICKNCGKKIEVDGGAIVATNSEIVTVDVHVASGNSSCSGEMDVAEGPFAEEARA
jgi:hypothetical protein